MKTHRDVIISDVVEGHGPTFSSGDYLNMRYVLTIGGFEGDGGRVINSTRNRKMPFLFKLGTGAVLQGWEEGIAGMRTGGQRRVTIPPALAYGTLGFVGLVPPNSTLFLEVELVSIGCRG